MTTSAEVAIRNLAPGNMSYTSKRRKLPPASALEVAVRLTLNTNRGLFEEGGLSQLFGCSVQYVKGKAFRKRIRQG